MPAFQLTKDLFHREILKSNILDLLTERSQDDSLCKLLLQVLHVENAKEQIEVLKKTTKEVTTRLKTNQCLDDTELPLKFLVHVFFISTSKNPCRKVLISHFQGLPENVRETVIGPAIKEGLQTICKQPITAADNNDLSGTKWLRHGVDTVSALIENFHFGEACVQEHCFELLTYLGNVQEYFFLLFGEWLSPVQRNEVMHHCLETVKLANRICQRSSVTIETRLKESPVMELFKQTVSKFITTDIDILKTDDFLIDCKTTSAMNIWLLLKTSAGRQNIILIAVQSVFSQFDWLFKSCDSRKLPDWLKCLSLDGLSRSCMTDSAYLCTCYGFLSMVAMETLLQPVDGHCLLLDILLQEFLMLSQSCSDVGNKLLAAKSIGVLTQKLRDYLDQHRTLDPEIKTRLHGNSADMKTILQFVYTSWEDSVDAIRFTVKDIFENVVAVHLRSTSGLAQSQDVKDDPLLHQLAKSILDDVSWTCKGKYPTLSVLVHHLGSTRMLVLHPGITGEILQQMQEQTLACYACDLYEKLFLAHLDELGTSLTGSNDWFQHWLDPVLKIICGTNVLQKKHVIEYILPKLLKTGSHTLQYITQNLSAQSKDRQEMNNPQDGIVTGDRLSALIVCLRRARSLGLLKSHCVSEGEPSELWCGMVDVKLLQQALVYKDDQTRLDAFALLCENQKTSEIISTTEIRLIQNFIPENLNNQDPAFRQHFLSNLKKFLSRMKESRAAVKKKSGREPNLTVHLNQYQDFLCWLTRCLFNNLYPGSVFARRTTCLTAIALLVEIYGEKQNSTLNDYNFFNCITLHDVNSLVFCLIDTFEDNKQTAATTLIACAKNRHPILTEDASEELFDIGISLSQSTRPQDSTTAAYLFSVLTHQPSLHRILLQYVNNKRKSRVKTSDIESNEAERGERKETKKMENEKHQRNEKELIHVGEIEETDKQKHEVSNGPQKFTSEFMNETWVENESTKWFENEDSELTKRYMLLSILLDSLESQTELAKRSLVSAAANRPMYPTLQCMRYCFTNVDFRNMPFEAVKHWKELVARVLALCFDISGVVCPVVCNSSPEGNVPVDALTGIEDMKDVDNVDRSAAETVMLMPEYLIVCCWRSVKEISLLLAQLTSSLPNVGAESTTTIVTYQQVLQVGTFYTTLLLESKHRGAFELAYAGFVKVTEMLWRSSVSDLHLLPGRWLAEVMADIVSGSPESRLCATRRSAGVPFYIQALVTTEPTSTGRQCFKQTIQELLTLAMDETIVSQDKCTPKVHALNVLRALYKDSRLKDDVASYVADGLKVAILGFKSPLWAVRNSATLLMTAMMTRIFGVKRSKDETTFSRKNCQTGRTFFYNYPSLYQFLLDQIAMATENVTKQLHPGLFPILMVLGRLFPSAMEGTDTSLNLGAFIPFIVKCSANPVLKTRVMAAKALQPLVEKDHVTSVFQDLLNLLPRQPGDVLRQNHIHGILLQVLQLCQTIPGLPVTIRSRLQGMLVQLWTERMDILISRKNVCLTTRAVALEVTCSILQHFPCSEMSSILYGVVKGEIQSFETAYHPCTPTLSQFQSTVCRIYCDFSLSDNGVASSSDSCHSDSATPSLNNRPRISNCGLEPMNDSNENAQLSLYINQLKLNEHASNDRHIEAFILACLKARSYEVREVVLHRLTEILSVSVDLTKGILVTKDNIDLSNRLFSNNQSKGMLVKMLLPHLLDLLDADDVEENKVQLLRLLTTKSVQLSMFDRMENRILQTLHNMLQTLKTRSSSDNVTASMIVFVGVTLSNMKHSNQDAQIPDSSSTNTVKGETIQAEFIETMRGYTGLLETSTEILLACAGALVQNGVIFLGPNSRPRLSDFKLYMNTVKCVLDLLQSDDIDVRETMVTLVHDLSSENMKVPTHPYVALADFLNQQFVYNKHEENMQQLLMSLIEMIAEEKQEKEDVDERLFDRGEMNTYWDEIDFLQKLDNAISKQMNQTIPEKSSSTETVRKALVEVNDITTKQFTDMQDFLKKLFFRFENGVKSKSAYSLSYRDIFFNINPSFHDKMLFICKTLIMCKYGDNACSEKHGEFLASVQQTKDSLKYCSRTDVWLPVLHKLLTDI